jgi:MAE_28990/MAE_18760-like HEPN
MPSSVRELSSQLERDLDWRSGELAIFRELLVLHEPTEIRTRAIFRAAWLLLYAHYEGFCKYALQLYSEFLASLPTCECLCDETFVFVHQAAIRRAKNKAEIETFRFFREEIESLRRAPPPIVEVDTQSNLWPNLLQRILFSFDIPAAETLSDVAKIKTLVARRNDIAHGKQVFINDLKYYSEYEGATQALMYSLALAIVKKATHLASVAKNG